MKNLSVALLAAAALSTSAMANNGFYLGASAGVAQTNAKYDYQSDGQGGGLGNTGSKWAANVKTDGGKAAGLFGLFAGYGALVGSGMYVGGEIYGGIDTTNFKPYDSNSSGIGYALWQTKVERKYYYGLAARFGVMATPSTLIYLRLAAESGKWKATVTPNGATVDAAQAEFAAAGGIAGQFGDVAASKKTVTTNKTGIQFAPGAGVEVYVNKNLFVRAEYSYLFGPKITMTSDASAFGESFSGKTVTHHLKTSQHSMKVGIGYKF